MRTTHLKTAAFCLLAFQSYNSIAEEAAISQAVPSPASKESGMTVAIDPVTGKFRDLTPEEKQTLERQRQIRQQQLRMGEGEIKREVLPDGSENLYLGNRLMHTITAETKPEGAVFSEQVGSPSASEQEPVKEGEKP